VRLPLDVGGLPDPVAELEKLKAEQQEKAQVDLDNFEQRAKMMPEKEEEPEKEAPGVK
jgi:hypothetical protein